MATFCDDSSGEAEWAAGSMSPIKLAIALALDVICWWKVSSIAAETNTLMGGPPNPVPGRGREAGGGRLIITIRK